MIARKYETIVGFFVVASLAALLVMVLIIAQQEGLWQDYLEYEAVFKNISGLKKGSEVRLAGVTVGSVTKTAVRPDGKILVTFEILEKYKDQIRKDSQASIGMIGLLGDRSLDLTSGSPDKPILPPGTLLTASEPLDLQELLARAGPSLENIQKVLNNLVKITDDLANPKGDVKLALSQLKEITEKVNRGEGTLGLLVNDPSLFKETSQAVASARKVIEGLNNPQGVMGMLLHDPAFRAEFRKTLTDLNVIMANLRQGSVPVSEAAAKLPGIVKKLDTFVDNLTQASGGLPDLVVSGQGVLGDADKVAQAALKSWLLRWYVPQAKERTIQVEREIK